MRSHAAAQTLDRSKSSRVIRRNPDNPTAVTVRKDADRITGSGVRDTPSEGTLARGIGRSSGYSWSVMDTLSRPEFVDFVRHARLAVLTTASIAGRPEAALMEVAVTRSAELIFDTPFDARKIEHIRHNDQVAIVVGWQAGVSIQVEGTVRIAADKERAYYEEQYLADWPNARVMDRSFAVLVVTPAWVSLYDATPKPPLRRYGIWMEGAP